MVSLAGRSSLIVLTDSRTIPIASVLTPATLTVHAVVHAASETKSVPILDFNATGMARIEIDVTYAHPSYYEDFHAYHGPQYLLTRIGTATAILRTLLDIRRRFPMRPTS